MTKASQSSFDVDIALIGAGIHSATLGTMLRELDPRFSMRVFERQDAVAMESSHAVNNAGTGHAAYCELNYTPQKADGNIEATKALNINEQFERSLEFWSGLVASNKLPTPSSFINPCPHMTMVLGEADVSFLRERHRLLSANHLFRSMRLTEDKKQVAEWTPLLMEDRDMRQPMAVTRVVRGTDVDYGALTRALFNTLGQSENCCISLSTEVLDLTRYEGNGWMLSVRNRQTGEREECRARFVFIGAGGGALPLLLKSGIPEGRGYGGFPVSGQFLMCTNEAVIEKHAAKVYGKASIGAPPMSVPHLDSRMIHGKRSLYFGPYAGLTTKFQKRGSNWDLFGSIRPSNFMNMLTAGLRELSLVGYLAGQVVQSHADRVKTLQDYFPAARPEDWKLAIAGQRVQIIRPDVPKHQGGRGGGKIELGTEVVSAADGSIAALLGASPGASTAAITMVKLIEKCFPEQAKSVAWQDAFRRLIPSYGQSLAQDASLHEQVAARNNDVLGLHV